MSSSRRSDLVEYEKAVEKLRALRLELLDLGLWGVTLILVLIVPSPGLDALLAGIGLLVSASFRRGVWYLDPGIAFGLPWLFIVVTSGLDWSVFSRDLSAETWTLLTWCLLMWWLGVASTGFAVQRSTVERLRSILPKRVTPQFLFVAALVGVIVLLTIFQVRFSGYIPLIEGVRTGQTRYLSFGAPTIYGLYLAAANATALASLYRYANKGRLWALVLYVFVAVIFIFFVTRQNLISLGVSSIVLWSLARGPIRLLRLAVLLTILTSAFFIIGEVRTGNIREVAGVPAESRLPTVAVWLLSYTHFNLMNLDNVITQTDPAFDGSSLAPLIPSVFRSEVEHEARLERPQFTVRTYLAGLVQDVGSVAAVVFTLLIGALTAAAQRFALFNRTLSTMGVYAVLYFCAAFSFFTNFWYYLPVIFQVPLLILISRFFEVRMQWVRKGQSALPRTRKNF